MSVSEGHAWPEGDRICTSSDSDDSDGTKVTAVTTVSGETMNGDESAYLGT
jgi:hypothetical protein